MAQLPSVLASVQLDTPLLIRLLEQCREDVKTDAELHFLVEGVLYASSEFGPLSMVHYDAILQRAESLKTTAGQLLDSVQARLRRHCG